RNQLQSPAGQMRLQVRDHADFGPRSPSHGEHAGRKLPIELGGQFAEHFVGGRVIGLTAVAIAAGKRGKENQELQLVEPQVLGERQRTVHLGTEYAVERFGRLVAQELVFDNAGTVDYSVELAVAAINVGQQLGHGVGIANVDRVIFDG